MLSFKNQIKYTVWDPSSLFYIGAGWMLHALLAPSWQGVSQWSEDACQESSMPVNGSGVNATQELNLAPLPTALLQSLLVSINALSERTLLFVAEPGSLGSLSVQERLLAGWDPWISGLLQSKQSSSWGLWQEMPFSTSLALRSQSQLVLSLHTQILPLLLSMQQFHLSRSGN